MWPLLIVGIFLIIASASQDSAFSSSQYQALYDLYNATKGWDWKWFESGTIWNFTNPADNPCSNHWQGLSCVRNGLNNTLSRIILHDHNLQGSIPDSVQNFVNVTYFDLAENELTGSIPACLFKLSHLHVLSLDANHLTGSLTTSISGLPQLFSLNLRENKLHGQLPDGLYQFTNLVTLDLSNNEFSGIISDEIGNLQRLRVLQLSKNNFSFLFQFRFIHCRY
jgi:Leucine-rich repeat (LRR) protein